MLCFMYCVCCVCMKRVVQYGGYVGYYDVKLFYVGYIFVRVSIYFNYFVDLNEQWNFNYCVSRQGCWFIVGICGVVFQVWIGFNDFQFNEVWWGDCDWLVVLQGYDVFSLIQQLFSVVIDCFCVSRQLFEGFVVYEVLEFIVVVQVSQVYIDNVCVFCGIGRFESFFNVGIGQQMVQFNVCKCLVFIWFNEFVGFYCIRFVI